MPEERKSDPILHDENLAIAYYQIGVIEKALAELDQLIANAKSTETCLLYRTLALVRLGRVKEVRDSLAKFLEETKPNPTVPTWPSK